jgi:hypothetical protein
MGRPQRRKRAPPVTADHPVDLRVGGGALEPAPPSVKQVLIHATPPLLYAVFIPFSWESAVHGLLNAHAFSRLGCCKLRLESARVAQMR